MKKLLYFLGVVLLFSCSKNEVEEIPAVSNNLKQRVVIINSFNGYVSDSIVEHYSKKMLSKVDSYVKTSATTDYIPFHYTFEYNDKNMVSKVKYYNDKALTQHYATIDYFYNADDRITKVTLNRFSPSNLTNKPSHNSTFFELSQNTLISYRIDHLDGDSRKDLNTYVIYGNIDSVQSNNKWISIFDNENDITNVNCIGNDCDTYYNAVYKYQSNREPLVTNIYGNSLNTFLLGYPSKYLRLEYSKKYTYQVQSLYPNNNRNGNTREFSYIFDENNRLIKVEIGGTFATTNEIRYYYEGK